MIYTVWYGSPVSDMTHVDDLGREYIETYLKSN